MKIFTTHIEKCAVSVVPGSVRTDGKSYVAVAAADGWVYIDDVQLAGKKRMAIKELLLGWRDVANVCFAL
jgi:methionyl-tRNA formyltransferase